MVESSALLKRRSPKGYRGFESLPHRVAYYQALTEYAIQVFRSSCLSGSQRLSMGSELEKGPSLVTAETQPELHPALLRL